MAGVELKGVQKFFGQAQILKDVDLGIGDGEFCVFVGPSGCGKSTLLRMVAGLESVSAGEVHIGGRRMNGVPAAKRGVAMVFQSYALYPHMTVRENMAFSLKLAGQSRSAAAEKVRAAAAMLQIEPLLDRRPKDLSGGQRQRVAIGRAIVRNPGVFLFDEPLSNLDAALRVQTRIEIANLHRTIGHASMIYVTHDQVEAMTLADRIVLLRPNLGGHPQGSIAQIGTPLELYTRPSNQFVAGFIGSPRMNFIPVELGGGKLRLRNGEIPTSVGIFGKGAATLGIRPEHVAAHVPGEAVPAGATVFSGTVKHVEHLGDASYVYALCAAADEPIIARADPESRIVAGDEVRLALDASRCHVFDAAGDAMTVTH